MQQAINKKFDKIDCKNASKAEDIVAAIDKIETSVSQTQFLFSH